MNDVLLMFEEFRATFDFERIRAVAVPERFGLLNLCNLIYMEAKYAKQNGVKNLSNSPNFNLNQTFRLYAMLVSKGVGYNHIKRVGSNYCRTFAKSDIYYAQTAFCAMGILMMIREIDPIAIRNFLAHILGREFLLENANFDGRPTEHAEYKSSMLPEIQYKPYEGQMRKIKYDLLAIFKFSREHGIKKTEELINQAFHKNDISFYFNMLNVGDKATQRHIYDTYEKGTSSRTERIKLNGAMGILNENMMDTFSLHSILNSIVGKYTLSELNNGEVQKEVDQIYENEILPIAKERGIL